MVDSELRRSIERVLKEEQGGSGRIVDYQPVSGGSIHRTGLARLADGRRVFVKSSQRPLPRVFEREAEGLAALGSAVQSAGLADELGIPTVLGLGRGDIGFLLLEAIEPSPRPPDFSARFGAALAKLHRSSAEAGIASQYGFGDDNYLGATPQPNGWSASWVDFWRRQRLGHQLGLARRGGQAPDRLLRLGDRLMNRLGDILTIEEPPTLIHGDLWGGNYLVGQAGAAVLIDPAVYYGQREAELAMTRLFGGFDAAFYRGYGEAWPLEPESELRLKVYELYHLLNHLNLFGGAYAGGCLSRLETLVA